MDDRRVGATLRALRRRAGLRQREVATRAGCHQTTVSRAERGELDTLSLGHLRRLFGAVGARFDGEVRWRGGAVDRLVDQRHAALVEAVARQLRNWGWTVIAEVTFSEYGERGSIDLLAADTSTRAIAVLEMKTEIGAVEETIRRHDVKTRLAPKLTMQRLGWRPVSAARILVLPEGTAARSGVARHSATFRSSYPASSRQVRAWLRSPTRREPAGARAGLGAGLGGTWFLTLKHPRSGSSKAGGPQRVRAPK